MARRAALLPFLLLLAGCDAAPTPACAPAEDVICDILRPEDIEAVPGVGLLVSELGGATRPGRILLVEPASKSVRVVAEATPAVAEDSPFPKCGPPPTALRPRGFHLSRDAEGGAHLLVVAGARIERYRLEAPDFASATLTWEGCVAVPPEIQANDVAGFPNGDFVVSHMYDPPRNSLLNVKFLLGLATGRAVKWTAGGGWTPVPNTDASFANGIQVDPASGRIYVSSMFTQRIIGVDGDGGNRRESRRLPNQIDNLTWSEEGRLVGAGHTGTPVYGISACRDIGDTPCSFPFAIVALDPATLADQTLYQTGTGSIPGASVGLVQGNALYLGTAFGDRITRITLKN